MIVSAGNSIRFYQDKADELPNFDNRPFGSLVTGSKLPFNPQVYVEENTSIYIQCMVNQGNAVGVETNDSYDFISGNTTLVKSITIGDNDYHVYDVEIAITTGSNFKITLYEVEQNVPIADANIDAWISPCITAMSRADLVEKGYLNIKYFSDSINTLIDYSEDLVSEFWIRGEMFEYNPDSEVTEFKNAETNLKLNETLKRNLLFKAGEIVSQQVEQLKIAMKSDYFIVNDVQFTQLDEVDVSYINNYADVSVPITQVKVYL